MKTRFRSEASKVDPVADQLRLLVDPGLNGVILCDPFAHPAERRHARAVQVFAPGLDVIAMPFSGHPPTKTVMAGGVYQPLLQAAVAGCVTPAMIRAIHVGVSVAGGTLFARFAGRTECP